MWKCFKCEAAGCGELKGVRWLKEFKVAEENMLPAEQRTVFYSLVHDPTIAGLGKWAAAWAYLRDHHVSSEAAKEFKVGLHKGLLVLPAFCPQSGRILFYQTRSLTKRKSFLTYGPRSLHVPVYRRPEAGLGVIVVVESMVSAMRLSHIYATAALCGKAYTQAQLIQLRAMARGKIIVLWLDGDSVAQSMRLRQDLSDCGYRRMATILPSIPEDKYDPCDVDDRDAVRILENARRLR